MTCDECCIFSGVTDWHKDDYDRPVCPFYKNKLARMSYVDIAESEWKAREEYKKRGEK